MVECVSFLKTRDYLPTPSEKLKIILKRLKRNPIKIPISECYAKENSIIITVFDTYLKFLNLFKIIVNIIKFVRLILSSDFKQKSTYRIIPLKNA